MIGRALSELSRALCIVLLPTVVLLTLCGAAAPAAAACHVAGDSIAFGTAQVLGGCTRDAKGGIPSAAVVPRAAAGAGADYLVVSAGSNDFPRGLPAAAFARARAHVEGALNAIAAARGRATLILILPANGARPVVAAWAAAHRARTVAFVPGRDGVHPASYAVLARAVLAAMGPGT